MADSCVSEEAQDYVGGKSGTASSSKSLSVASSAPSSSGSRTSFKTSATTASSNSSRTSKPYDRPVKAQRAAKAKSGGPEKKTYEYTRLPMEWTPRVEAELIKAGWLVVFTDGACSGIYITNALPSVGKPITLMCPRQRQT